MMEVLQAGLCDLVVDMGRPGYGALGVPAGGASDRTALAAANALVGNDTSLAGLEISLAGPTLMFPQGAILALTGARFTAIRSSGAPVPWGETLVLAPGESLSIGHVESGCRCWLALRGGFEVPQLMGSRSTFLPGGFGGYRGRSLQTRDRLGVGAQTGEVRLLRATPPAIGDMRGPLRVVAGPQATEFADEGLAAFFGGHYQVQLASDRRGLRLAGPAVTYVGGELSSQGVFTGAIQIPPDGQPIILGWDGPVTGGYPVIAGVITADQGRLAQLKPGDAVQFETVEVERARAMAVTSWRIEELA